MPLRSLRRDDRAVNEIVGYILMFAMSSVILSISTQAFLDARTDTQEIVHGVELRTVAGRVASRIVQGGVIAQEFPNATVNVTLRVAPQLDGMSYHVQAAASKVTAAMNESSLSAEATTYNLGAIEYLRVVGVAGAERGKFQVGYKYSLFADIGGPHVDAKDLTRDASNKKIIYVTKEG